MCICNVQNMSPDMKKRGDHGNPGLRKIEKILEDFNYLHRVTNLLPQSDLGGVATFFLSA